MRFEGLVQDIMVANGDAEHKSLADYASSKQNGKSAETKYPVNDQNYGFNALGCSKEVHLLVIAAFTSSSFHPWSLEKICTSMTGRQRDFMASVD